MKNKFINLYMDWADRVAQLSHAVRLNVGAVVVKDDTVISYGYNGMPAGWDNNCENIESTFDKRDANSNDWTFNEDDKKYYRLKTKPEVLHAESNAIAKLAKSHNSGLGATMFITHAPCLDCAKLIYQSGIGHVLYRNSYRDTSGITFLEKSGVKVEQMKKDA
jgi:dCMP deaminase